jgi:hypothetical protein
MGTLELATNVGWSAPQIIDLDFQEPDIRGGQVTLQPGSTFRSKPDFQV